MSVSNVNIVDHIIHKKNKIIDGQHIKVPVYVFIDGQHIKVPVYVFIDGQHIKVPVYVFIDGSRIRTYTGRSP
jgi:hypothetical protein